MTRTDVTLSSTASGSGGHTIAILPLSGTTVTATAVPSTTGLAVVDGTTISFRAHGITLSNGQVFSLGFGGLVDSTTTASYEAVSNILPVTTTPSSFEYKSLLLGTSIVVVAESNTSHSVVETGRTGEGLTMSGTQVTSLSSVSASTTTTTGSESLTTVTGTSTETMTTNSVVTSASASAVTTTIGGSAASLQRKPLGKGQCLVAIVGVLGILSL